MSWRDLFKNPDIGHALRLIADQGPKAFYTGEIAAAMLKTFVRNWAAR